MKINEIIKNRLILLNYIVKEKINSKNEVTIIRVYLPILCYLKIKFTKDKTKISSRTFIGSNLISIELNFIIYLLMLALLLAYEVIQVNSVLTIFFILFLLFFIVCIIKLEFIKLLIINLIEKHNSTNN